MTFCPSHTLAYRRNAALDKGFAQGDKNTSKWVGFPCCILSLPLSFMLPVFFHLELWCRNYSRACEICWARTLTATSLVPIGYFRKLPENWEWGAFHSCWLIRRTVERAELTSAFYECAYMAGSYVERSSWWWQMQNDLAFCTSTTALKCKCYIRRKLDSSTKQTHMPHCK